MIFADTNWLAAIYIEPDLNNTEALSRRATVERYMRRHRGQLILSPIVLLEARNVFSRITEEPEPQEWSQLEGDFNGKLYVDPMNWHLLRRECEGIFSRYSWKHKLGTFDVAVFASAKLAACNVLLSFDSTLKALALAEGVEVFPPLDEEGTSLLAILKDGPENQRGLRRGPPGRKVKRK